MMQYPDPHSPDWTLETGRLTIRPLVPADLDAIHAVLVEGFGPFPREQRAEWLDWMIRNYTALARLYQPPYGERGIVLKESGVLIGAVGFVSCLGPFDTLPWFRAQRATPPTGRFTTEFGLFWALSAAQRGQGYATEAARALMEYGFGALNLQRIVATTTYDNGASIAVMRRLGMQIEHNPHPSPDWFQVVGIRLQQDKPCEAGRSGNR